MGKEKATRLLEDKKTLDLEGSDHGHSHHHHHHQHQYLVYGSRWIQVLLFSLISLANALTWITFSPIANTVACFYGVSSFWVDWLSLIFMAAYIPCFFIASWSLDSIGLRFGLIVGAVVTGLGALVRAGATSGDSFWVLFFGQTLCAIAQPFILNAPPKVASNWFPDGERTIATTICVMANPIGVAIGFVLPPIMSPDLPHCLQSINMLLMLEAVICIVIAIIFTIFFREKPPTPPSASQDNTDDLVGFWKSLVELFKDFNFILLFITFGLGLGAFNTLATLLPQILAVDNYSDTDSGLLGALLIILGLVGAGLAGAVVDKTHAYKLTILASLAIGACTMAAFSIFLAPGRLILMAVLASLLGFAMTATLPLCLELSCEIAYPIGEATPSGLLMTSGQIGGIVMVIVMDGFIAENNVKWCNWLVTICVGAAFGLMLLFRGRLKRREYEQGV